MAVIAGNGHVRTKYMSLICLKSDQTKYHMTAIYEYWPEF